MTKSKCRQTLTNTILSFLARPLRHSQNTLAWQESKNTSPKSVVDKTNNIADDCSKNIFDLQQKK